MKKELISGVLAGVMAATVIPATAGATTNLDALYKVAHTATTKAMKTKDQGDINSAREAVKALPVNLNWAKGEFSKQLDKVQQPILKAIVDAVKVASAEDGLTQANINTISNSIPDNLPKHFKASYSSARDNLQIKFQDKVVEAVKLAEEQKTVDSKLNAQTLVNELKTTISKNIAKFANEVLQVRLDAIVVEGTSEDIEVHKIVNFDTKSITVEFFKLENDIKDATIKVQNLLAEVIEVKPVQLKKGDTTATFEFVTPIEGKFTSGFWLADGVSFNALNTNFVTTFANLKNDDVKGLESLVKDYEKLVGIENIVHSQSYYKEYLKNENRTKATSLKDVQKVIDSTNQKLENSNEELYKELIDLDGSDSNGLFSILKDLNLKVKEENKLNYASENDSDNIISFEDLAKDALYYDNENAKENMQNLINAIDGQVALAKLYGANKATVNAVNEALDKIAKSVNSITVSSDEYKEDIREGAKGFRLYEALDEKSITAQNDLAYLLESAKLKDGLDSLSDEVESLIDDMEEMFIEINKPSYAVDDQRLANILTVINNNKTVSKADARMFIEERDKDGEIIKSFNKVRVVLSNALIQ